MKKSALKSAIATALGIAALAASSIASAGVMSANWTGYFVMLDPDGAAMANTSAAKGANQQVTLVSGTLQFDDIYGAGIATVAPFNFFSNASSAPFTVTDFDLQAIGDGMGNAGTLVLGNMLFTWGGANGIPISLVMDAAGFFAGEYSSGGANSAVPATDGTWVGVQPGTYENAGGYLQQGSMPMVTTAWNTTNAAGCTLGNCMGVSPSGVLPLVLDTTPNVGGYDTVANTGAAGTWGGDYTYYNGIGGNPMQAGPFQGTNANFNIGNISVTSYDANASLNPNCSFSPSGPCPMPPVPIPAAVWLFGSGLLGLMGVARRRTV